MDSMKELEKQAERLLGELTELRRNNRLLAARVKKLEKVAEGSSSSESRARERSEVKRRLEHLVHRLETLDSD
ncbi:MAG: hypothetical protein IH936_13370 [Acidobacteria bacterium]|nr:hypothetical protein [Acidobacteriota bacterium]